VYGTLRTRNTYAVVAASLLKLKRDNFDFDSDGPSTVVGSSLNVLVGLCLYFMLLLFQNKEIVFFDLSFHFCATSLLN
jgi:hypothetical protein